MVLCPSSTYIIVILPQIVNFFSAKPVTNIFREHGISKQTFCNWKRKFGDMNVLEIKSVKQFEAENSKFKEHVANLSPDNKILKDIISKTHNACNETRRM